MDGLLDVYWCLLDDLGVFTFYNLHLLRDIFDVSLILSFVDGEHGTNIGFVTKSPGSRSEISAPWLRHPARWNARVFSRPEKSCGQL